MQLPSPSVMDIAMSAGQLLPCPVKVSVMSMELADGLAMASTTNGALLSVPDSVAVWEPEMEHSQPNCGSGAVQDPSSIVAVGS